MKGVKIYLKQGLEIWLGVGTKVPLTEDLASNTHMVALQVAVTLVQGDPTLSSQASFGHQVCI